MARCWYYIDISSVETALNVEGAQGLDGVTRLATGAASAPI